jgi:hypothetical protein
MPTVTAPYIETQQVVTGRMYELTIAEQDGGQGITRLEIGPYYFPGVAPRIKYPEAVTNEACPPDWSGIRWVTDENGASWLRWDGGRLMPEDGEMVFRLTSNYPPSDRGQAALLVWRGASKTPERFKVPVPDYSQPPPQINPRHDVIGKGITFVARGGCLPPAIFGLCVLGVLILRHLLT